MEVEEVMPTEILYEGSDIGYYDWRFPLQIGNWCPNREILKNERAGERMLYESFVPEYDVRVHFVGVPMQRSMITLEGDLENIQAFRAMVEKEQSALLEACEVCD